eukprot:GFYU01001450.1.p1 GENE.GFYU01001450.1~~GFYU01001450.1.p1  ORF type:complete len:356 (+),score=42.78 GFYU01001450.1:27-1070(+)
MYKNKVNKALLSKDIAGIAQYIASGACKKVAFLTGAGISVAAGIPDFRSPGGMYDTLRPDLLTASATERSIMTNDPTHVVSWDLFKNNQFPYLEVRRPFILGLAQGQWKPTLGHWFQQLCHDKGLLTRVYTQNIDGLDFCTDLPQDKIISVHGTMGEIKCEFCKIFYPMDDFRKDVTTKIKDIYNMDSEAPTTSSNLNCPKCHKAGLKPNTVLYGTQLPDAFFEQADPDLSDVDLLFVIGTSLTVYPACEAVTKVKNNCVRVIVNDQRVGQSLGVEYHEGAARDVWLSGASDQSIANLIEALDWGDSLNQYVERMAPSSVELVRTMGMVDSDDGAACTGCFGNQTKL